MKQVENNVHLAAQAIAAFCKSLHWTSLPIARIPGLECKASVRKWSTSDRRTVATNIRTGMWNDPMMVHEEHPESTDKAFEDKCLQIADIFGVRIKFETYSKKLDILVERIEESGLIPLDEEIADAIDEAEYAMEKRLAEQSERSGRIY